MKTNWNDLYKIRIRELTEEQTKHLIVKTLIVQKLLIKHKSHRKWIRVYTEFNIKNGKISDVYYENLKTNEIYCYEIQSKISKKWLKETIKFYNNLDIYGFTTDLVIIDLNKLSNNIDELSNQLEEYIM